jgi:hypothetical protein
MSTPLTVPPVVTAYLELVRKRNPKIELRAKEDSKLMKLLGFLVKPFNPTFNTRYTTTIGTTIWMPSQLAPSLPEEYFLEVVTHECQHILDDDKSPVLFKLSYLFPQVLALLSLAAILAIWWPICLLWLASLLFLAPIPAYWRYKWELNGYRTSILFDRYFARSSNPTRTSIADQLTGPSYYFAWPFRTQVLSDLNDESFLEEPRYKEITAFLNSWYGR